MGDEVGSGVLLAHRRTLSSGEMMRTVGRSITRCPEPHCGGQLFVQDEQRAWGHWERSLVCSLCGREREVSTLGHTASTLPPPDAAAASGGAG